MKHSAKYDSMFRHSHYLWAAMNLAVDRDRQLDRTAQRLGVPLANLRGDELTRVQQQTAKEFGGVQARMLLDAPECMRGLSRLSSK